jgi:hypothetical protein
MLFKANITNEIAKSEDSLCEQLYLFLNDYIPTRLPYENHDEQADCIQDTVLYLFKRFNKLLDEDRATLNLEKFFYNRARSYVSGYIKKMWHARKDKKDYIRMRHYLGDDTNRKTVSYYIDYNLLDTIITAYKLSADKSKMLKNLSIKKLVTEFNFAEYGYYSEADISNNETLVKLSMAIVDEYILKNALNEIEKNSAIKAIENGVEDVSKNNNR